MSPAVWSERSYYHARDAARRAWQAVDDQLVLGLDEALGSATQRLVEPAPASPSLVSGSGLNLIDARKEQP